jgi:hypothetical protein
MKKLLITTALTASLISSAALAETKFGGNIETTYTTGSRDSATATSVTNGEGFGTDVEITVSHSKELDNGWGFKANFAIDESGETNAADTTNHNGMAVSRSNIALTNSDLGLTIGIGSEGLQLGENYIVPSVGDVVGDIGQGGANAHYMDSINDSNNLAIAYNTPYGTVQLGATPQRTLNKDNGDSTYSTTVNDGGGAVEGSFGTKLLDDAVEVFAAAAQGSHQEKNGDAVNTGNTDFSERFVGASYNFGKGKIGLSRRIHSASQAGTATTDNELETDMIAVAFNISDNVSVGYQDQTTEGDSYATEEEGRVMSIGYNFGGVTFTAAKVDVDADGGVNTTNNDFWVFRTKTSF